MAEQTDQRSARDLLRVAFRRRSLFLLGAAMFALACLVGAHSLPLKYTGETKFQRRSDSAAKQTGRNQGSESFETLKLNLMHDLAGQRAIEQVTEQLGMTRGFPRNSEGELTREGELAKQLLVAHIQKSADIKWEVKSEELDLVSVSVVHHDASLARQIPDALVKNYIEKINREITDRLTASRDFLLRQVADCQSRLTELEKQRIEFETRHAKTMPESPGAVQKEIDRVEGSITADTLQKQDAEIRLWAAQKKFDQLRKDFPEIADALEAGKLTEPSTQPAATQPSGEGEAPVRLAAASQPSSEPASQPAIQPSHIAKTANPEHERIQTRLRQERDALDSARIVGRMKDTHPIVQALLAKIERLEGLLSETPTHVDVPIYATTTRQGSPVVPDSLRADPLRVLALTDAKSDVEFAKREIENVDRRLKTYEERRREMLALMANFVPIRQQWQELTEKIKTQQDELKKWDARLEEVQMSLAAEVAKRRTHLEAVQAAQEQILPSSPKLVLVLGAAVGGALAFAVGLVFVANLLDRSVTTTEDALDYFGLPVHGVIGEIISARQRHIRKLKRWLATPAVMTFAIGCVLVAGLSIVLRLKYPDAYPAWQDAPLTFLYSEVVKPGVEWVSRML